MRALLIHRFFYPDSPPYAVILKQMSEQFLNEGFDVDVLSSKPSYKALDVAKQENYKTIVSDKLKIFRLPVLRLKLNKINKLFNFFWFPLAIFIWILFRRGYTVVSVSTAPPVVLSFIVALVCRIKGSRLIYHCMDIHPEIGRLSGEFRNAYIFKLLTWMDNFTCDTAYKIIVLSQDMKKSLVKRRKSYLGDNIVIINNYELPSDESVDEVVDSDLLKKEGVKRVVFAGNIGRYQNLHSFINPLLNNDKLDNFELVFVGEGVALKSLKLKAKPLGNLVKFISHQSVNMAKIIIRDADMAIVSLNDGVIEYAYPSKTMTYLSQGTPVLLSVGSGNELSDFVSLNKVGVRVDPSDEDELYNIYKGLCHDLYDFQDDIQSVYKNNFAVHIFNEKLSAVLNKIKMNENEK